MGELVLTALGAAVLLAVVYDAHSTILHSRGRNGPIAQLLFNSIWRLAVAVSPDSNPGRRHRQLNAIGPLLMPLLISIYLVLLLFGFALIYYPRIGTEFVFTSQASVGDWNSSLYFSAVTLTTTGYGDIAPHTSAMRVVAFVESLAGLGLISLSISYLVAIYRALERKRTAALGFYLQAEAGSGAVSFIANHMVGGKLSGLAPTLRAGSRDLQEMFESHVEHPIIHYFHPEEVYKGLPRVLFVSFELCAIIKSCFDRDEYRDLLQRAEVATLESSALHILDNFTASLGIKKSEQPDDPEGLRHHVERTIERLGRAGVKTRPDAYRAFEEYAAHRAQWAANLHAFARYLGYDWEEITHEADLE
jgi:hypothetical protein